MKNDMKQELQKKIKEQIGTRLSDKEIESIAEQCDIEELPEIIVTSNPKEFDKKSKDNEIVYEHSWAGSQEYNRIPKTLYGDYSSGKDKAYTYYDPSQRNIDDQEYSEEKHELSDFSMNKTQVVLVHEYDYDNYNRDVLEESDKSSIVIYVPENKHYDIVSYRKMIEQEQNHQIDEIEEIISDRTIENINSIKSDISRTVKNEKEKDTEHTL